MSEMLESLEGFEDLDMGHNNRQDKSDLLQKHIYASSDKLHLCLNSGQSSATQSTNVNYKGSPT